MELTGLSDEQLARELDAASRAPRNDDEAKQRLAQVETEMRAREEVRRFAAGFGAASLED